VLAAVDAPERVGTRFDRDSQLSRVTILVAIDDEDRALERAELWIETVVVRVEQDGLRQRMLR